MLLDDVTATLAKHPRATISFLEGATLREKTFIEAAEDARELAARLESRGVARRSHVAVLGDNSYAFMVCDLALAMLACHVTALPLSVTEHEIEPLVRARDVDLVLLAGPGPEASPLAASPLVAKLSSPDRIVPRPRAAGAAARDPDVRFRVFSSGTTGTPRCIAVSLRGLSAAIEAIARDYAVTPSDSVLLFLPVANLQQRLITYAALTHGVSIVLSDPLRLFHALKTGRPSLMLAPPLFYDALLRRATAGRAGPFLRLLLVLDQSRITRWLARPLLRSAGERVKAELGGRVRLMITGMAPTSMTTLQSLVALGLPLFEAYGMTEFGIIACNTAERQRLGSVGKPAQGVQIEIAPDGEIVARREPRLTLGYEGESGAADDETYRSDGRIGTGDVGFLDSDGFLYVKGRKKNIIVTADGQKLHPEVIEREIMNFAQIAHCGVVQNDRDGLICVAHVPSRSQTEQARAHIERCITELGRGQRLESVVFLNEPFSPTNGLLTPNLKLDRTGLRRRAAQRAA